MYRNFWSQHSGFFIFWVAAGVEETLMMRRGFVGELDRQAPSQRSIPVSLQRSVHMHTYFMFARTKRRRASDRNVGMSPFCCGFWLHGVPAELPASLASRPTGRSAGGGPWPQFGAVRVRSLHRIGLLQEPAALYALTTPLERGRRVRVSITGPRRWCPPNPTASCVCSCCVRCRGDRLNTVLSRFHRA